MIICGNVFVCVYNSHLTPDLNSLVCTNIYIYVQYIFGKHFSNFSLRDIIRHFIDKDKIYHKTDMFTV